MSIIKKFNELNNINEGKINTNFNFVRCLDELIKHNSGEYTNFFLEVSNYLYTDEFEKFEMEIEDASGHSEIMTILKKYDLMEIGQVVNHIFMHIMFLQDKLNVAKKEVQF
jgi:hypothetical protein